MIIYIGKRMKELFCFAVTILLFSNIQSAKAIELDSVKGGYKRAIMYSQFFYEGLSDLKSKTIFQEYLFLENGKVKSRQHKGDKFDMFYNDDGKLIKILEYNDYILLSKMRIFNYIDKYKVEETELNADSISLENKLYTYDSNGRLLSEFIWNDRKQNELKYNYVTDDKGRVIKMDYGAEWYYLYKYDDSDNLIEMIDMNFEEIKHVYKYDEYNNPIEEKRYHDKDNLEWILSIEYFK